MPATRRQVLLSGLVLAAACTTSRPDEKRGPTDPDERLRTDAVARERNLVQAYLDAMAEQPALAARLAAPLGDHTAHLQALAPGTPIPTARSWNAAPMIRAFGVHFPRRRRQPAGRTGLRRFVAQLEC